MPSLPIRTLILCTLAALLLISASAWAQEPAQLATPTAMARVLKRVNPDYPPAAKQLNIQGSQEISITVGPSGDVEDAKVIKGNAMFTQASLAAVKQWKFTPLLKDGAPQRFTSVITFSYTK